MPTQLKYVAQQTMDLYYQAYKVDSVDYFLLEDFIFYVGNTISQIYENYYKQLHAEYRSDKKDEIVSFDPTMLSDQILEVEIEKEMGLKIAKLKQPVMAFMYDNNTIGIQDVFPIKPRGDYQFERTSQSASWQLEYLPFVNKVFFYGDMQKVVFIIKGNCNVHTVRVSYVPSMYPEAIIPDGVIQPAITATLTLMRQVAQGVVTKEQLDGNYNKIVQTELNKAALA